MRISYQFFYVCYLFTLFTKVKPNNSCRYPKITVGISQNQIDPLPQIIMFNT